MRILLKLTCRDFRDSPGLIQIIQGLDLGFTEGLEIICVNLINSSTQKPGLSLTTQRKRRTQLELLIIYLNPFS